MIDLNEDKPKIHVKLKLEGDIASIQSGINYETPEKMTIIEDALEQHLIKGIEITFENVRSSKRMFLISAQLRSCNFGQFLNGKNIIGLANFRSLSSRLRLISL